MKMKIDTCLNDTLKEKGCYCTENERPVHCGPEETRPWFNKTTYEADQYYYNISLCYENAYGIDSQQCDELATKYVKADKILNDYQALRLMKCRNSNFTKNHEQMEYGYYEGLYDRNPIKRMENRVIAAEMTSKCWKSLTGVQF